jgi:type I restriction enzyme S subunit
VDQNNSDMKWERVELGSLISITGGGTPNRKNEDFWNGGIPWATVKDLSSFYLNSTIDSISEAGLKNSAANLIESGSVIIATRVGLGKVCITNIDTAINQDLKAVIPKKALDKQYLFYFLISQSDKIISLGKGATVKGITLDNLKSLKIPLPPLPEQRRLAARLDKADALRQKSRAVVEAYAELGRSVFLEVFGDPVRNERGWEVVELKKLADWKSGGTPSRSNKDFFNGDIPWYSSGELEEMYVGKSKENISEHALQNSAAKLIQPGSLLLGMYDTAALKSSITTAPSTCNQAIAFGKINEKIAEALYVYFAIQIGKSFYKRRQRGVRQKNMNLSMIKSLQIPLPPLDLQTRFARMVANIEAQRRLAERQLEAAEAVFGGVLQGTFGRPRPPKPKGEGG